MNRKMTRGVNSFLRIHHCVFSWVECQDCHNRPPQSPVNRSSTEAGSICHPIHAYAFCVDASSVPDLSLREPQIFAEHPSLDSANHVLASFLRLPPARRFAASVILQLPPLEAEQHLCTRDSGSSFPRAAHRPPVFSNTMNIGLLSSWAAMVMGCYGQERHNQMAPQTVALSSNTVR